MEESIKKSIYFHRIFSILLVCISITFLGVLIFTAAKNQQDFNKNVIITKSSTAVEEVLTCISNKETDLAIELIDKKITMDVNIPSEIRHYFTNFRVFYKFIKNQKKNQTEVYTEFFVINSVVVRDYLQNQCGYTRNNANMLSEIIPYFLIKEYDQNFKKNSKLYKEYLNTFNNENGLSKKTADILCLYIQNLFLESKLSDSSIKRQMNNIKNFQNQYERELGANGIYTEQKNFLDSFYEYLSSKTNSNFTIILLENYPKYTL